MTPQIGLVVLALLLWIYVPFFQRARYRRGRLTRPLYGLLLRRGHPLAAIAIRILQAIALWPLSDPWYSLAIVVLFVDDLVFGGPDRERRDRLPLKSRIRWKWLPDSAPAIPAIR